VKKVTGLYDVSIVGTPAYTQTDIKANREWEENIDAKLRDMDNPSDDEEKPKSITREQTRMKLQIRQHQRELDLMDM
jgi:HKD family nuclease